MMNHPSCTFLADMSCLVSDLDHKWLCHTLLIHLDVFNMFMLVSINWYHNFIIADSSIICNPFAWRLAYCCLHQIVNLLCKKHIMHCWLITIALSCALWPSMTWYHNLIITDSNIICHQDTWWLPHHLLVISCDHNWMMNLKARLHVRSLHESKTTMINTFRCIISIYLWPEDAGQGQRMQLVSWMKHRSCQQVLRWWEQPNACSSGEWKAQLAVQEDQPWNRVGV